MKRWLIASDVGDWDAVKEGVNIHQPTAIILAGDLVNDGWLKQPHPEKFYEFLEQRPRESPVFVIRGNHDTESVGYDVEKISSFPNTSEVTNSSFEVDSLRCYGLGFIPRQPKTTLVKLWQEHNEPNFDVLVSHAPFKLLETAMNLFNPSKLTVQAHSGGGRYRVQNTPTTLTNNATYCIVEWIQGVPSVELSLLQDGTETKPRPGVAPLYFFQEDPSIQKYDIKPHFIIENVWPWLQPEFNINDPESW